MDGPLAEGFVLTGGRSSRMGCDKALLPFDGSSLVQEIAERVRTAAGSVTLIGSPERYSGLGIPAVADSIENCGPMGGVYTALQLTSAPWNLILACDMPGVSVDFLRKLLDRAIQNPEPPDCVVPQSSFGLHPLCAVYHRRVVTIIEASIARKKLKMRGLFPSLRTIIWPVAETSLLENVNTPNEWRER